MCHVHVIRLFSSIVPLLAHSRSELAMNADTINDVNGALQAKLEATSEGINSDEEVEVSLMWEADMESYMWRQECRQKRQRTDSALSQMRARTRICLPERFFYRR